MDSPNTNREIDLFHEVLDLPAGERSAFVDKKHAGDRQLRERLHRLLAAHQRAEELTQDTPVIVKAAAGSPIDRIPEWIGPYRVRELIGEGGMGAVYAAEQLEPIRRRVAVKVIKLGMDTKEVIARFEAERQVLAILDHPGIAKVFDAGCTETGRPYFVMELVKGLPLTEYCEKHRLPLRDRLDLYALVCDAVQHAHQRGIIHRDLKPSNVLVTASEGQPVPKVIDFGVAKATASPLSERTVFTEHGKLIGTPEYMSPEQAEMSSMDVDTRTDVYSLGVMLYELLTGALPFDPEKLRAGGYAEIQRIIREVDPPRPSLRLAELHRIRPATRETHRIYASHIRGELDWIVMRAIDKDRTRRYESASDLERDMQRYLADLPVSAGPPSALYRVRKFVKRHRYMTLAMACALLAAAVGVTGLTIGLINAREAHLLADRRADNAQVAADFLQKVLFQIDPENGGDNPSLLQVIDSASESIETDLRDHPEVEASVRESIGVAYRRLSMYDKAEPHLRQSLELRRELLGDTDLQTARSFVAMADWTFEHEGSIPAALRQLRQASSSVKIHGLTAAQTNAWLLLDVGLVNLAADNLEDAAEAFDWSAKLLIRYRGPEHPDVSRPLRGMALVKLGRGDTSGAEELAREAVALCEGEGAEYIGARAKLVLAEVLLEAGNLDEAARVLTEARGQFERTVGPAHVRMAELDSCMCRLQLAQGDFQAASQSAALCEAVRLQTLDPHHWSLLEAGLLRQRAAIGLGGAVDAEPELLAISDQAERILGDDHPLVIAIAKARLDCARAMEDKSLQDIRADRLVRLEQARISRLERSRISSLLQVAVPTGN